MGAQATDIRISTSTERERRADKRPWHGAAFVVEALVLLVFLTASLALMVQLMTGAYERSQAADDLSCAVTLASNVAESFASDPASAQDSSSAAFSNQGTIAEIALDQASSADFVVTQQVTSTKKAGGLLYGNHVSVSKDGQVIYELDTSAYASDKGVQR